MTTCIKCGKQIPDGELFCEECGQNGTVSHPKLLPTPIGRMQAPVHPAAKRPAQQEQPAGVSAARRRSSRAARILAVCCVLLLAAGTFIYLTGSDRLRAQQTEIDRLQGELAFFDTYAVCVNDGSKLYHRYGCALFTPENFQIYSPKLAQAHGYSPCPECIGQ